MVLYGCETWFLTLWEQHRLRVFKKRVLRRIFQPKSDEVTGCGRKLNNKVLHNLYSPLSIMRMIKLKRIRWEVHVAQMGAERNAYRVLMRKPERKRLQGRPKRRRVDNIRKHLREV
jgi:hypothetical protein